MSLSEQVKMELFYAGLTKEEFWQVKEPVDETNRRATVSWSLSIGMFWLLSLFMSLFSPDYTQCRPVYIGGVISSIITWYLASFQVKKNPWLLSLVMYLLAICVQLVGIGIALYQPDARTVTMIAIALMVPNCFIAPTIRSIGLGLFTLVCYILLGRNVIVPRVYSWGLTNMIIFTTAGILIGHVINKTRFQRYLLADSAERMAEIQASFNTHLVMGMGIMVESRDHYTGGHSRRTSSGVRFLVDAMLADEWDGITEEFCENLVKAAPMHDVGKVSVDDVILRKPGRYTPEEYDQMKKHSSEGARILHEILVGTDDSFRRIAENVAHYHHERYDGTGYPDGLKGEAIPLEARVMAIADVYDALVSKRSYKECFSFEKANRIILEGMGTQFDPKLKKYYMAARPRLEAFYTGERNAQRQEAIKMDEAM